MQRDARCAGICRMWMRVVPNALGRLASPSLPPGRNRSFDGRILIQGAGSPQLGGRGLAFADRITLTRLPLDLEAKTLSAFCSVSRYDCQHCRNSIGAKSPDCGRNVNASTCAMPSEALACALRAGDR